MTILKFKDIKNLSKKELDEKTKELRLELIKSRKEGKIKSKEIKKAIARILTIRK